MTLAQIIRVAFSSKPRLVEPPQPIPYASRSDFQAAVERQRMARSRHAKGCTAVADFTLAQLRREVGR